MGTCFDPHRSSSHTYLIKHLKRYEIAFAKMRSDVLQLCYV